MLCRAVQTSSRSLRQPREGSKEHTIAGGSSLSLPKQTRSKSVGLDEFKTAPSPCIVTSPLCADHIHIEHWLGDDLQLNSSKSIDQS